MNLGMNALPEETYVPPVKSRNGIGQYSFDIKNYLRLRTGILSHIEEHCTLPASIDIYADAVSHSTLTLRFNDAWFDFVIGKTRNGIYIDFTSVEQVIGGIKIKELQKVLTHISKLKKVGITFAEIGITI